MLLRSGRNIYRIGFVRKIVDLHHCQSRRRACEEGMRSPRQSRNTWFAVRRQKALAAERPQQLHPVAVPHLALMRGFARAWKKPELIL
jgi:hypothetical protein